MPAGKENVKIRAMQRPATKDPSASAEMPVLLRGDIDGIALLTLNRPETRNALSEAMLAALSEALASIAGDSKVRAVVVAGNGPAFCAGHDLKEITEHRRDPDAGRAYAIELMTRCSAMMQAIVELPQPVIAAVGGVATAAGCQLVASCDLAVASTGARFGTPGVHIGLFCTTPGVALARNVSAKHAMEMLLTGDMISAEDAVRMGLVNRAVAPGSEREEALKLARKIAGKSAMTVTMGKRAFYRQREMPLAEAYRYASDVMVENLLKRDAEEGIGAFVEKRDPKWEDR
jgi:enoyl-CoA hydratase/carnithine racemase